MLMLGIICEHGNILNLQDTQHFMLGILFFFLRLIHMFGVQQTVRGYCNSN